MENCSFALCAKGITKRYGNNVLANDTVNFDLKKGEVHALLGENGAGKSTLMKCFYGLVQPDEGEIFLDGQKVTLDNSAKAINAGIGMIHQELMLIPHMTVAENVVLGREIRKKNGRLDMKGAEDAVRKLSAEYGFDIDPSKRVCDYAIGVQQRVEILKLLYRESNILILDEPTALLTPQEANSLFEVIRKLTNAGKSIIFITHKLKEVYQIADRMTVMRKGRKVITTSPQETDEKTLTEYMIGKQAQRLERTARSVDNDVVLRVKNLSVENTSHVKQLDNVSFEIHKKEILGVAGIEGNGQTQLAQALLGLVKASTGDIIYKNQNIKDLTTKKIREMSVGSVPDDRKGMGLILDYSISKNVIVNDFSKKPYAKSWAWLSWDKIDAYSNEVVENFDIRTPNVQTLAGSLSGGNQQKVVVGRELSRPLEMLIAAQPTRGVDFNSAEFIRRKILEAADSGTAVLLISSDLDELLTVCDRIMVLHRGENVGILSQEEATGERLGQMMLGIGNATTN